MSNLFTDEVTIDPTKDYSTELVGEGKKYKDWQSAARAILEKDLHISKIESETKALREDLQKRVTLEEVMTRLSQNKQEVPTPVTNPGEATPAQGLSKEQLEALVAAQVEQNIAKVKNETVAERNIAQVTEALRHAWGDNFSQVLGQKTAELGLGKDWVTDMARNQPKALLTLVGVGVPKQPEAALPNGGVNTAGFTSAPRGEKTNSYYAAMRKADPVKFHSKAVQDERWAQAHKLGDAFWD